MSFESEFVYQYSRIMNQELKYCLFQPYVSFFAQRHVSNVNNGVYDFFPISCCINSNLEALLLDY